MPTGLRATILATQAANLKAFWRLNEASGDFADSSGNSKTLTTTVDPTFAADGPCGRAASFNGTTQYASRTDSVLGSGAITAFTFLVVVKGTNNDNGESVLSTMKSNDGSGQIRFFSGWTGYSQVNTDGVLFVMNNAGTILIGNVAGEVIANVFDTNFHIIIGRYNGTKFDFFKDSATPGLTKTIALGTLSGLDRTSVGCQLGSTPAGFKDCSAQMVAWWDTALTDAEISALVDSWTTCAVYADGTGDFTSLATWKACVDSTGGERNAKCTGSVGNFSSTTWTPTTSNISPEPGFGHQLDLTGASMGTCTILATGFTIDGMRMTGNCDISSEDVTDVTIKNCILAGTNNALGVVSEGAGSYTRTLINNVILNDCSIFLDTAAGTLTVDVISYNNYTDSAQGMDFDEFVTGTSGTLNVTAKNNIASLYHWNVTNGTITSSNNLSENASGVLGADGGGGTGHLVDKALADQVINVASNWKMKAGAVTRDAGATVAGVTTDAMGTRRPHGGVYDIGPHEWFATSSRLHTGIGVGV